MLAFVALSAAALTAAATATDRQLYSLTATEKCLSRLPHAIIGLPPATSATNPAVFVYRTPSTRLDPPVVGLLAAYVGRSGKAEYDAVTFQFFRSARNARHYSPLGMPSPEDVQTRNVIVSWDHRLGGLNGWRKPVRACLQVAPPTGASAIQTRSVPRASLATFFGHWGGHTRGLQISAAGRGHEELYDGCCVPEYKMTFQILSVTGTLTQAAASYRVTRFKHYPGGPNVRVGQIGKLLLRNGIVTNPLSDDYFCSDTAWGATAACGA
jgi:hypothetical protein